MALNLKELWPPLRRIIREISAPIGLVGGLAVTTYYTRQFFRTTPEAEWVRPALLIVFAAIIFLVFAVIQTVRMTGSRKKAIDRYRTLEARLETNQALLAALNELAVVARSRALKVFQALEEILAIDYQYCVYLREKGGSASVDEIEHQYNSYVSEVLLHTCTALSAHTGNNCASSIKLFHNDGPAEKLNVFTFARDPASKFLRNQCYPKDKATYLYLNNTAFVEAKNNEDRRGFYHREDLHSVAATEYRNGNPRWREFYDSVAVKTINDPAVPAADQAIGYLCVDNMGGGFDPDLSRIIMECISSVLYYSMQMTDICIASAQGGLVVKA